MKAKRIKIDVTEKEFETIVNVIYLAGFSYGNDAYKAFYAGNKQRYRQEMARSNMYAKLGKKISDKARFG